MRDVAEMRGRVRRHMIDQTTGKAAVFVAGERLLGVVDKGKGF